jgi:hypothetical protein
MHRSSRTACVGFAVALCLTALANTASAQNAGFVRLIRPYHQVALAQLPEVEKELSLTDEQKQLAQDLNDDLNQERMALWQEAAGDFDSIREDMALLNNDIADEFAAKLDDAQKKRLAEIFAQANGPTALFDERVAEALKITEEQTGKLNELRSASRGSWQGIDWQNISEEEANAEVDKLIADQNEKYAAVMTDEQKAEFEKMQGEKLELDFANLPNPFGR